VAAVAKYELGAQYFGREGDDAGDKMGGWELEEAPLDQRRSLEEVARERRL